MKQENEKKERKKMRSAQLLILTTTTIAVLRKKENISQQSSHMLRISCNSEAEASDLLGNTKHVYSIKVCYQDSNIICTQQTVLVN